MRRPLLIIQLLLWIIPITVWGQTNISGGGILVPSNGIPFGSSSGFGITDPANFAYNPNGTLGPYLSIGSNALSTSRLLVFKSTPATNAAESLLLGDYNAAFDGVNAPIGTEGLVINSGTASSVNCPGASCNPFIGHIIGVVGNAQENNVNAALTAIGVEGRADNIQSTVAGQQHYSGLLGVSVKAFSGTNTQTQKAIETVLQSCNSTANTFAVGGPNNDYPGGHLICTSPDANGTGIALHITQIQGFATKYGIYVDSDQSFFGGNVKLPTTATVQFGASNGFSSGGTGIINVGNGSAQDVTGTLQAQTLNASVASIAGGFYSSAAHLIISSSAPTIAGAGCGGSAASIPVNNGTAAFKINVGTSPTSACTITLPAATTGWNCFATDITTNSTSVFLQKQTGAESTTSVTITNFSDVAVATAFVASDVLKVSCHAD